MQELFRQLARFEVLMRPHAVQLVDGNSQRRHAEIAVGAATDLSTIAVARPKPPASKAE